MDTNNSVIKRLWCTIFLISSWKQMLWVLIRSALQWCFWWITRFCGEIRKITIIFRSIKHLIWSYFPADTQHWNNVDSTLIQRQDIESMLNRRCLNTLCQLGFLSVMLKISCLFFLILQAVMVISMTILQEDFYEMPNFTRLVQAPVKWEDLW